jgi:hypothetical protein
VDRALYARWEVDAWKGRMTLPSVGKRGDVKKKKERRDSQVDQRDRIQNPDEDKDVREDEDEEPLENSEEDEE